MFEELPCSNNAMSKLKIPSEEKGLDWSFYKNIFPIKFLCWVVGLKVLAKCVFGHFVGGRMYFGLDALV